MKLIWKFNLVLLGIFLLGFVIAGYISYRALQANAREEILQNARLMMEAALSSRTYTVNQVKPLLDTHMSGAAQQDTIAVQGARAMAHTAATAGLNNPAVAGFLGIAGQDPKALASAIADAVGDRKSVV